MQKDPKKVDEPVGDLEAIRRLLVLLLVRDGAKQADLAELLGVSPSTISRMMPKGASRRKDAPNTT